MKKSSIKLFGDDNKISRVVLAQTLVFIPLMLNAFRAGMIPQSLILALAMALPLILKPVEIPAYMAGFAMMGTGIQVAYIALSCAIVLLVKTKMKIQTISLVAILGFIIYEMMHMVFATDDTLVEFLRYASVYVMLFLAMFLDYNTDEKINIVNSYIYGTVVSILHIFLEAYTIFGGNLTRFIDGSFRFGYAEQIGYDLTMAADPNLIGQSCSFVIVFCLSLIMLGYKNNKYYIAMFVALLAGTLTISKTFLISVALIVLLVFLFGGSFSSTKMLGKRIGLICIVFIGVFLVSKVNPDYIENLLSRVDENDVTTGRVRIAVVYLGYLTENILGMIFGLGMQNIGTKIGRMASPHAAFVEAIACWGVFGTLLMLLLIFRSVYQQKFKVKSTMFNYIPFIVFAVLVQSTQLFRLRDRLFGLLVVIVLTGIPRKGEKSGEGKKKSVIDSKL